MKNTIIEVRDLFKEFDGEIAVNYISFTVAEGEFVTLLGPSGCGKTTILRMLAGFDTPSGGDIYLYGNLINSLAPYSRPINTVFQNYALFPHMNVSENIAFPLRLKKKPRSEVARLVEYYLGVVNLQGYEKRSVDSLSGGQQQRVAIARALANEPKVLLLDEPLSALDLKLRKEMQIELKRIQREVQITFLYVTHDQEEALSLSDKIIVMRKGEIQQIGSPIDIYNEPVNAYVADFIGESNIIDAVMESNFEVSFLGRAFPCVDRRFPETTQVKAVIRPEDLDFCRKDSGLLNARIGTAVFKGVHYEYTADSDGTEFLIQSTEARTVGEEVGLTFDADDIHIMRAEQRNILDASVIEDGRVRMLGASFGCDTGDHAAGTGVKAVIKPADWILLEAASPQAKLTATIAYVSYYSERYEMVARAEGTDLRIESITPRKTGDTVGLDVDSDDIALFSSQEELIRIEASEEEEGFE